MIRSGVLPSKAKIQTTEETAIPMYIPFPLDQPMALRLIYQQNDV